MAEEEQMETCQESFQELETQNSIDNPPSVEETEDLCQSGNDVIDPNFLVIYSSGIPMAQGVHGKTLIIH